MLYVENVCVQSRRCVGARVAHSYLQKLVEVNAPFLKNGIGNLYGVENTVFPVIKNNGVAIPGYSWNADDDATLPSGWYMSSGSKWEEYTMTNSSEKVGYVEGGGYIYIPNMLNNSNYTNLTVEIVAFGDGAAVTRIAVNDMNKTIANTHGITYTWGSEVPLSPAAAPRRDNPSNTNNPNN